MTCHAVVFDRFFSVRGDNHRFGFREYDNAELVSPQLTGPEKRAAPDGSIYVFSLRYAIHPSSAHQAGATLSGDLGGESYTP